MLTTSLDQFQQAVVNSPATSIRMVAPAGSGKTETLSLRVQKRIEDGCDPRRILLLTFDTNARAAIVKRLERLGVPNGVRVNTLNAFGLYLLNSRFTDERRQILRGPYFPQSRVLNDLVMEYGHSVFTEMLGKIKNEAIDSRTIDQTELARWCAKNRAHLLRNLEDDPILEDMTDTRFGKELAREMQGYEQFLQERNGIDFDDQKLRPLIRLQESPRDLEWVQDQFDEVIVDEFQDINRLDALLIDLISTKSSLLITGDDDQAIYGFRGATAGFLIEPQKTFHRTFTEFELAINYRCPPKILTVASDLIQHNEHRIPKDPRAQKTIPGEVEVYNALDTTAECDWIARHMKKQLESGIESAAVLARRRVQLVGIQSAFIRNGTPFRIRVEEDVRVAWSLARRALLLAPLRVNKLPEEDVRGEIVRIFAEARSWQPGRVNQLVRLAQQNDLSFPGPELLQQLHDREQTQLVDGIKSLTGEMSIGARLRSLDALLATELRTYMEGGKDAARDRGDSEKSRLSGLIYLAQDERLDVKGLVKRIDTLLEPQRASWRSGAPVVELSTCHGAKGREWELVCIPHCNQGVFPDSRSEKDEHLEAERKLFYVSMTRASKQLVMTWSSKAAGASRGEPSQFLIEASVEKPPAAKRGIQMSTWKASSEKGPTEMAGGRRLGPDGSWAMSAAPKKLAGPVPRYLTLVTPRGRSMQNALDLEHSRMLADAIDVQHNDRGIDFESMHVKYSRADGPSTVPLQVELALRGTPFAIGDSHRFPQSSIYQAALRAWSADSPALADAANTPIVDALAAVLERLTDSDDSWLWLDRLEALEDEEPGNDEAGVQFIPQ